MPRETLRARIAPTVGPIAVILLATLLFVGKPLHIDDPADLQYVRQILRDPLDPYGFEVDWDEGPRPAFRNYHPPLKYYYHALVLALFPPTELVIHASYLPFVAITAWALVRLGRRFACPPTVLLVLWMLGPGYLPGQNAMLDVPAMALGLAATALFIEAVDKGRTAISTVAGIVLGAALLTKYAAVIYVPVWVAYVVAFGRRRQWIGLVTPGVIVALWCGWTAWRYGEVHPWILFERVPGHESSPGVLQRIVPTAVFLGGSMPVAALFLAGRGWRGAIVLLLAGLTTLGVAMAATPIRRIVSESPGLAPINLAWWFVLALSGFGVILQSFVALGLGLARRTLDRHDGDQSAARDDAFLGVWFLIALALGACASPFLAMRRVVEASLPGWMVLLRRDGPANQRHRVLLGVGTLANCVLGFLVAAADYEFASVYPRFAAELAELTRANPTRVWCHGYWGWSHYTRAAGLQHYVLGRDRPAVGSLLIIPAEVAKPATLPDDLRFGLRKKHSEARYGRIPIRLMSHQAGAGYYSSAWGPLPYAWSLMPWEAFDFYELEEPSERPPTSRND